jgi:uncharacterized damage-inducible protein DinB
MKKLLLLLTILALALGAFAQDKKSEDKNPATPPSASKLATEPNQVYERQLSNLEGEFVPAAEAMPADKFDFKPSSEGGDFAKSRTFRQQVGHVAANNYLFASLITGDKSVASQDDGDNGPDIKDKDAMIKYLKDSFAAAHKAMQSLNKDNLLAGATPRSTKMQIANLILFHGFDHYGQMAIYLRMNGIVPPASRGQ